MTPRDAALTELIGRLQLFVSGGDRSPELVSDLSEQMACDFPGGENFPDADAFSELEVAAACFRPGGGQFMYDEAQMALVCRYVLARLGKITP